MTPLPATARRVTVTRLSNKFRECTEIETFPVEAPAAGQVLVKTKYVGINASDIIYSAGGYDPAHTAPMTAGLEGMGEIVAVGEGVGHLEVSQTVAYLTFGSFAEYVLVEAKYAVPLPDDDPALLCIGLSGITASIALEMEGDLKPGKTVLVTAAAGGTGQFAVQIAKQAGCHVIGTCSSPDKVSYLQELGCDRVINYTMEDLDEVLRRDYPGGVDVAYEAVGKKLFLAALSNLARRGRLIVIGGVSTYARDDLQDWGVMMLNVPVAPMLLRKSASIRGFFLLHNHKEFVRHISSLTKEYKENRLRITMDKGETASTGPFLGLEKVVDAVDYMFEGRNIGKVVVQI